jgi:hypothetical protein
MKRTPRHKSFDTQRAARIEAICGGFKPNQKNFCGRDNKSLSLLAFLEQSVALEE